MPQLKSITGKRRFRNRLSRIRYRKETTQATFIRKFLEVYRYGEFSNTDPSKLRKDMKKFLANDKFWNAIQSFHTELKGLID